MNSVFANHDLVKKASSVFPSSYFAVKALINVSLLNAILNLVLFLLVSIISIILFLMLGEGLYLKGIIGLTQSSTSGKKLNNEAIGKLSVKKSQFFAYATNEWKALYRTPAFLLNCVITGIVFSPLMIVLLSFSLLSQNNIISSLNNSPSFLAGAYLVVVLISTFNLISVTAVSRNGQNFYINKYIPVDYKTQILGKLIPGLFISYLSLLEITVVAIIMIKINLVTTGAILVISFFGTTAYNIIGLFIDINFPKLEWDDETRAVKQNINVLIQNVISIGISAILVFVIMKLNLNFLNTFILLLLFNLLLCKAAYMLLISKGVALYSGGKNSFNSKAKNKAISIKSLSKLFSVLIVVGVVGYGAYSLNMKVNIKVNNDIVKVDASIIDSFSFKTSDIQKVYFQDTIPESSKVIGSNMGSIMRGVFNVQGMGKGHVYTETDKGPFLYVKLNGDFVIINYKDENETKKVYNELINYSK